MDQNDPSTARIQRIMGGLAKSLGELVKRSPRTPGRLSSIASQSDRHDLAIAVLSDLIPEKPDESAWTEWLEGGGSPRRRLQAAKYDDSKAPSSRKIQTALGARERAHQRTDEARETLKRAQAAVADAEDALRLAERTESIEDAHAKGAALWAYLREIHEGAAGAFAMGPAWTLMRVVSGYLQNDVAWEASLSDEERRHLQDHRKSRAERSKEMLEWLDGFSGYARLEVDLFDGLYDYLKERAAELPNRSKRKVEEARSTVGAGACTTDAAEVLKGLRHQ